MIEDKQKIKDIITEIDNLKKYNNQIATNISGEVLENYVNKMNKDILDLEKDVELIYEQITSTLK